LACAAVAAKLMGLEKDQIKHALGIAEYHAPNAPMMRDIDHPSMVKHAVGWGAMNGVTAAELASRGFTGIPSILGFEKYRDWVSNLGRDYVMTEGVGIKRWCSCAWGHPALFATLKVVQENHIQVHDITHIKVRTFHEGWRLFQGLPTTTEQAQFSIKWPLATLLIDGVVGPDQVLEYRLGDEAVRALVAKIEVVEDPEIDRIYRSADSDVDFSEGRFVGRTEILLTDGRSFDSGIVGRRPYEWDEERLEKKFRWIGSYVLDDGRINELVTMGWEFENVSHVRELIALLTVAK
jgi:2-methylcitrate dehydratase PrpD